jgi:hypothetical protein
MPSAFSVSIDYGDVPALLDRLGRGDGLKRGLQVAALYLKGRMSQYPAQRPQPFQWVSEKQRRYVMAAIRSGEISVPYARGGGRSETLGKRWATEERDGGLTQIIGNNASYSPFVQGAGTQALYHRGNWQTTEQVARRESNAVRNMIVSEIEKDI